MLYVDDPVPALKRQLAEEILALAATTHFSVAATGLGVDEPRLSDLRAGRLERFSLQKLIRMLANLRRRVVLTVETDELGGVRWFQHARERYLMRRRAR